MVQNPLFTLTKSSTQYVHRYLTYDSTERRINVGAFS